MIWGKSSKTATVIKLILSELGIQSTNGKCVQKKIEEVMDVY